MTFSRPGRTDSAQTGPAQPGDVLSPAQQRIWALGHLAPDTSLLHVPVVARLTGELDHGRLEAALHDAVARHPVLATRFTVADRRLIGRSVTDRGPAGLSFEWHRLEARDDAADVTRRMDVWTRRVINAPFSLEEGPLVRGCLISGSAREHLLVLVFHRLIADTTSAGIVFREALALHASLRHEPDPGERDPWAPRLSPADERGEEASWSPHPAPVALRPQLPYDRPRPTTRDLRVDSVPFTLPPVATAGLRDLARGCGGGPASVTLALFVLLLHRYSGQTDPVVTVTTPGRSAQQTATVGCFESALPIGFSVDTDMTFRQLVRLVHQRAVSAVLGAAAESETAPDSPAPGRAGPATVWPAFSHRALPPVPASSGLTSEVLPAHSDCALEDLGLHLWDDGQRLRGQLVFATGLFDSVSAHRTVGHLLRLTDAVLSDPDRPVGSLAFLTAEEVNTVAVLNSVVVDVPETTFSQVFEQQAERSPHAVAIRAEDTCLSYGELNTRANQLAHLLRERGVGPEVTVGLVLERSAQLAVAVLAVLKAGGTYVPVDPDDPPARRDTILEDASVRIVVAHKDKQPVRRHDGPRVIEIDSSWSAFDALPPGNPRGDHRHPSHAAYLLYTSGSTGRPKGVVIEHRQLMNYVYGVIERFDIREPLSFAMVQPLTVDSSVTALVPPLCTGGEVHMITRERALDATGLADWFERWPVDCLKIAPSHLRALQLSPRFTSVLPRRLLVVGGEASDWRWLRELQQMAPQCQVFNHYGPTETTVGVLTLAVADHVDAKWTTAPIGVPLPNTQAYVVDEAGQPVPVGVAGELLIGGDSLARGYHGRDDLTHEAFIPDHLGHRPGARLYRTGDIVRRLPSGIVEFIGRRDDQIKVRGFRVALGEIDAALMSCPEVRHAVTVVREDTPGDRRIVSYVEPERFEEFRPDAVHQHIRGRLPSHMMPRALVPLPRLPLSDHGKVDRRALPPPVPEPSPPAGALAPGNDTERRVAQVWMRVLDVADVGLEQNFFDLGGHSLLLVELQHRLQRALGKEIDLLDLFQHTTVRAQADFFSRQEPPVAHEDGTAGTRQQRALLKRRQQQLRTKRGRRE
ncbi:non-ribosomal peptide synthetase [Streptomyces sp. NRRL S-1022]|uniref:non-ribosomal peptide synthetase n=1 Tax=Streptomyces sp. NRRL S-1022 TaxID=1463880 RepID=UPI00099C820A|nr:non-ribosomal peptide synthetase [Streptomyces sp. NRRL S-1022]